MRAPVIAFLVAACSQHASPVPTPSSDRRVDVAACQADVQRFHDGLPSGHRDLTLLACASLYSRPACATAMRDGLAAAAERGTAPVFAASRACAAAYCPDLGPVCDSVGVFASGDRYHKAALVTRIDSAILDREVGRVTDPGRLAIRLSPLFATTPDR